MKMQIGKALKTLRFAKGLTQEEVAEAFCVSAQAVSRWENDTAYPDITLLPGLAMFYETTVDQLMGMDGIRREETLRAIHGEILRLVANGQIREAVALNKEALKTYPNNSGLLLSLGETLTHQDDEASVGEAITVIERGLQNSESSMKAKGTAAANLLFLYLKAGRIEQAKTLVRSLPHVWESREVLLPEVCDGEAYAAELKQLILKLLVFLCGKIDSMPSRRYGKIPTYFQLGVNWKPKQDAESMLEQIGAFLRA